MSYQEYPRNLPFFTPFGMMELSITERNHIYLSVPHGGGPRGGGVVVNKVEYYGSLHLNAYDGEWCPSKDKYGRDYNALHLTRRGMTMHAASNASEAARKKFLGVVVPLVRAWAAEYAPLFERAQEAHVANRIASLESDIEKHEAAIATLRAEIETVRATLEQSKGTVAA